VWELLRSGLDQRGYRLVVPPTERLTLPVCPAGDPLIGQASIAFGKPNPPTCSQARAALDPPVERRL
jgi:hypothetical protein